MSNPESNNNNLIFDDLDDVTQVVLKEAKKEDRLTNQLLITMLSAYSKNPINLLINAPSGVGKNYVIGKVSALFPKSDIVNLAGMSEKALFHRQGTLVIEDKETGLYKSIEPDLLSLEDKKDDLETEYSLEKDKEAKQKLKTKIKEIEKMKRDLLKESKKLIDLQNKILVFLDTPPERLIIGLLPLLSHDQYEVEYEYADTHNGIKTLTNILRGWPVVIIAQAIDRSKSSRFEESQRRFITTNPTMSKEKYKEAIDLICYKNSIPDIIYQHVVVNDQEKDKAREIIKNLKEQILYISSNIQPGSNAVINTFESLIRNSIPNSKPEDMTRANRINAYLSFLPTIYFSKRPRIEISCPGRGDTVLSKSIVPVATFDDLKKAIWLMEYSDGVRPHVLEWYYEIFLKAYDAKEGKVDLKENIGSKGQSIVVGEVRPAVTTQDIIDMHKTEHNETLANKKLLEMYLDPLLNRGYIDKIVSEIDHRRNIYYPIIETKKISKLFGIEKTNNLSQESERIVVNSTMFPDKVFMRCCFQTILNYSSEIGVIFKIKNNLDQEITLDEMIDQYFGNPEDYFQVRKEVKENTPEDSAGVFGNKQEQEQQPKQEPENNTGGSGGGSDETPNELQYGCNYCTTGFPTYTEYSEHHQLNHPEFPERPTARQIQDLKDKDVNAELRGNAWE